MGQSTYQYSPPTSEKFMDIILPVFIGVGPSMDCSAVCKLPGTAAIIALCSGVFQTGMTLPGWAAGTWLIIFIAGFDQWLAFLLLVFIS